MHLMKSSSLTPHDLNDAGNADRLVAYVGGNLAYVPESDVFIHYQCGRWHRDEHGLEVRELAEAAIRQELATLPLAGEGQDYRTHDKRQRFMERSLNKGLNAAMIHMAKSRIAIPLALLDSDDHLLGVRNGILDLESQRLIEKSRDYYVTRMADVAFEPEATCPLWQSFMAETFGNNQLMIDYVEGIVGNMLSGHTRRQEFYMFIGDGANGKSTLISLVATLMGDYARSILPSTLFERQAGEQGNYDLALLPGVRLAVAHEAESRLRLNSARLKQLTGTDEIAARPIRRQPFNFRPKCKIVMVANKRPQIDAYDEALKRRVRITTFPNQVPEDRRDPYLLEKLLEESPGILNRLVSAGARLRANQIAVPPSVYAATQSYFADMDYVAAFLEELTEKVDGAMVAKADLYAAFVGRCKTECLKPRAMAELTSIMKRKGFEETRSNSVRGWKNLRLLTMTPPHDKGGDRDA